MIRRDSDPCLSRPSARVMKLHYGLNEADSWWYFAHGPARERLWARIRELRPRIIRIFAFDKGTPDPVEDWATFASYIQAVLEVGATPMITFALFREPHDDARAVRRFATRCADIVWGCIEQWGGEAVRDWYWCVWNEPNSTWIGGGLSFERYRAIYEEVAHGVRRWLDPYLADRPALIGGPSVEGFDPFWLDWIWRFVNEVDPSLVGFVNWHRYADWRDHGEKGAPQDGGVHRALMLAQTSDYEARAQEVGRLLGSRRVLNVCGEWNAHSHYAPLVRARFNQTMLGAAFGSSALLHLIRGGADAEMLWTGTDEACGYGVLDKDARPTPLFHAKKLCAQYIRYGDCVTFPAGDGHAAGLDFGVARGPDGRESALLVHLRDMTARYVVSDHLDRPVNGSRVLKLDAGGGNRVEESAFDGAVTFQGYGVAVVTNAEPSPKAPEAELDGGRDEPMSTPR